MQQFSNLPTHRAEARSRITSFDLLCFSSVSWHVQRQPLHQLMDWWGQERRIFFIEIPRFHEHSELVLAVHQVREHIQIVTPFLPQRMPPCEVEVQCRTLVNQLLRDFQIRDYLTWYTEASFLNYTDHLEPYAVVYDQGTLSPRKSLENVSPYNTLLEYADLVLFNQDSLNAITNYGQQSDPSLWLHPQLYRALPAWMCVNAKEALEDDTRYWKNIWTVLNAHMEDLIIERSNWPCYSLASSEGKKALEHAYDSLLIDE